MKRIVKGLLCSILSLFMMTQNCLPAFAQANADEQTVEEDTEENSSQDLSEETDVPIVEEEAKEELDEEVNEEIPEDESEEESLEEAESIEVTNEATSGECGTYATWSLDDNGVLTIAGRGMIEGYASRDTKKYTDYAPWYNQRESIKSVVIGENITYIGEHAFYNCTYLTSVTIPEDVTCIDYSAFSNCRSLASIVLPNGMITVSTDAFRNCENLVSITIPSSVTCIEWAAFFGCSKLKKVFYAGTQDQWKTITDDSYNDDLLSANIIYGASSKNTSVYLKEDESMAVTDSNPDWPDYTLGNNYTGPTTETHQFSGASCLKIVFNSSLSDYCTVYFYIYDKNNSLVYEISPYKNITTEYVYGDTVSVKVVVNIYSKNYSTYKYSYQVIPEYGTITYGNPPHDTLNLLMYDAAYEYSKKQQEIDIRLWGGSQDFTYEKEEVNSNGKSTDYFTFEGRKLYIKACTPVDVYTLTFRVIDNLTGEIAERNIDIHIDKSLARLSINKSNESILYPETTTFKVYDFIGNGVSIKSSDTSIADISISKSNITGQTSICQCNGCGVYYNANYDEHCFTNAENGDGNCGSWRVVPVSVDIDVYTVTVTPKKAGTVTFTASYAGDDCYEASSKTFTLTVESGGTVLEGYSLSLSGQIGVNFYMSLSDSVLKDSNAYLNMKLDGKQYSKVKVSDAKSNTKVIDGKTYYVFPCYVPAKNMKDQITIQLFSGTYSLSQEYSYSVDDYSTYILKNYSSTSSEYQIMKKMVTYGKYAQIYFGYNATRGNYPTYASTSVSNCDLSNYQQQLVDTNSKINFVGARLVLESKPGLKLYFNKDAQISCSSGKISTEGKYKVVTISNIDDIYTMYSVTGTNFSLKYSIASYGNLALKKGSEDLQNLIKAMVAYYDLFS